MVSRKEVGCCLKHREHDGWLIYETKWQIISDFPGFLSRCSAACSYKVVGADVGPLSRLPENGQPSGRIRVTAAGGFTEAARKQKGRDVQESC